MSTPPPPPRAGSGSSAPAGRVTPDRRSLWMLLLSLIVLQFGYPVTMHGPAWTVGYLLVYGGVIAYGIRLANANPRRHWPIVVASGALIAGGTWFAFQQDSPVATGGMLAGVALLQLSLLVTLLAVLVRQPDRAQTVDLLLVAVSAYLLLGGTFGAIAGLIELEQPGSFVDTASDGSPLGWQTLLYGSYVTLATLGYGDVAPVSPWARSAWSFEAVIGTLFVAVVIARLVGVAGFPARDQRDRDKD